jgi:hypothetical protein
MARRPDAPCTDPLRDADAHHYAIGDAGAEVTAVMPGMPGFVTISGTPDEALPLDEWVRLESDHPNLEYVSGAWVEMWSWSAGQNEYRYSVDADAAVRLDFEGEGGGWRLNGGIWTVDGESVGVVDSYSPGAHRVHSSDGGRAYAGRNAGEHNPASPTPCSL